MWHTETDLFALILFFIMLYKNLKTNWQDHQQKILINVLVVSILCCIIDYISSVLMNNNNNWFLFNLFLILYYASIPTVNGTWLIYLIYLLYPAGSRKLKVAIFIAETPVIIYSLIALSNPFTNVLFTLTKDMVYTRGPLYMPMAVWFYTFYAAIGLIFVLVKWKQIHERYDQLFLVTFFSASVCIPFLQVMHPGLLIAQISYAVLFVLCDATVEEEKREKLVSKIQQQNEELKEAVDSANSANAAKSDFLSRMSHDIRTPINGILGMTYLAKEQKNPPKTMEYLDKIDTSSQFLLGLINDVLDMSHMENQQIELKEEPYVIDELNTYIDSVIRPLCEEKGQFLKVDERLVDYGRIPLADKLHVNQIIFNLLSNAVKYTPEGGMISYSIADKMLDEHKMQITHVISDTGIGMSEEFQKILFDPFSQEHRNDVSKARGTGLGLAIVKKLVDRMGGTIEVQSAIGKGSTFTVTLCFDTIPAEQFAQIQKEKNQQQAWENILAGKHILVCEDHPMNQEIIKTLLEEKKCVVSIGEDGKKGLELFKQSAIDYYDAILMDVHMPNMDGLEAAKAIRKLDRKDANTIPIIAITADAFIEDVKKSFAAGMNEHITKPINPKVLYEVLHDVIQTSTMDK